LATSSVASVDVFTVERSSLGISLGLVDSTKRVGDNIHAELGLTCNFSVQSKGIQYHGREYQRT
jgi:hypothetical protein